ncbi:MAG: hypothetical protein H6832_10495 [Planctomycetes bacterium]|nr:hypothetical protein [Planctomycetota bacterium]
MAELPELVLGVGGGAATFKAVAFASLARQAGFAVHTLLGTGGRAFVRPLSFTAVTGHAPITTTLAVDPDGTAAHLRPARGAAFVILPATGDLIAKLAHGHGDCPVSLGALSAPERRYFCPAMNDRMWKNPFVRENVARLEQAGWQRIGPETGPLAEGYEAIGRMTEPQDVLRRIVQDLEAARVLPPRKAD